MKKLLFFLFFILSKGCFGQNPYLPIYCESDLTNVGFSNQKVIYKEVSNTKIEIPNMPAFQEQSELGECGAYSLAALIQKHICDTYTKEIIDCSKPPSRFAISYFGMLIYTYTNKTNDKELIFNSKNKNFYRRTYESLLKVKESPLFILDTEKPYQNLIQNLNSPKNKNDVIERASSFLILLSNIYNNRENILNSDLTLQKYNDSLKQFTSSDEKYFDIKYALRPNENGTILNLEKFTFRLLFDNVKKHYITTFDKIVGFPDDKTSVNTTVNDLKIEIKNGLLKGKPVLINYIVTEKKADADWHSLIICGYKKVFNPNNKSEIKEVYKIHNSYGEKWQNLNNNGWVDADRLLDSINPYIDENGRTQKVPSGTIFWIE